MMANPKHLEVLRQGVETWNQWRNDNADVQPDLSGAGLSGLDLRNANFSYTDLSHADLAYANLLISARESKV